MKIDPWIAFGMWLCTAASWFILGMVFGLSVS